MRLRLLHQASTWIALAVLVRLLALTALPFQQTAFLDRASTLQGAPTHPHGLAAVIAFLQRRTELHPFTVDEAPYDEMARNLVRGRGFVLDSVWIVTSPGQPAMYAGCTYPAFVAANYWVFGEGHQLPVFLLQIVLQGLAAGWVFRTAKLLAGPLAGGAAAAYFSLHPILIWCSLSLMSEAILIPGVAWLAWLLTRHAYARADPGARWRQAVGLGVLLALMCLTRSTCFGFVLVTAMVLVWRSRHQRSIAAKVTVCTLMLAGFAVACAPWTARNYVHWHRFIPFSTKSGVNAWFFNHPGLHVEFTRRAVEGPQPIDIFDPRIQSLPDEAARDARLMEMFHEFVREHPGKFLGLCWIRFWMALLPTRITSDSWTAAVSAWYAKGWVLALMIGAGAACASRRLRWRRLALRVWPLLLLAAYWQAIQTLAGPGMRYRLPIEPVWTVLVGVLSAVLCAWLAPTLVRHPQTHRWLSPRRCRPEAGEPPR